MPIAGMKMKVVMAALAILAAPIKPDKMNRKKLPPLVVRILVMLATVHRAKIIVPPRKIPVPIIKAIKTPKIPRATKITRIAIIRTRKMEVPALVPVVLPLLLRPSKLLLLALAPLPGLRETLTVMARLIFTIYRWLWAIGQNVLKKRKRTFRVTERLTFTIYPLLWAIGAKK